MIHDGILFDEDLSLSAHASVVPHLLSQSRLQPPNCPEQYKYDAGIMDVVEISCKSENVPFTLRRL